MGENESVAVYQLRWDRCWSAGVEDDHPAIAAFAQTILATAGAGRVLDVGCGRGGLVTELLKQGLDAHGVDVSQVAITAAQQRAPDRFICAAATSLPYPDGHFDCVVANGLIEYLDEADVPRVLSELRRICRGQLLVRVQVSAVVTEGDGRQVIQGRSWWEQKCFNAGFRKHPGYFDLINFESLNFDDGVILLALEAMPAVAGDAMHDSCCSTGIAADAELYKYHWAAGYVRPGDRVLDLAAATGAGSYLLSRRSEADTLYCVIDPAARMAFEAAYAAVEPRLRPTLAGAAPEVDFVAALGEPVTRGTLEGLLGSLQDGVSPGGRVLLSLVADGGDAAESWPGLQDLLPPGWYLEQAFSLLGGIPRGRGGAVRAFSPCGLESAVTVPKDAELLLVVMRDPLAKGFIYRESVYGSSDRPAEVLEFARDYRNPWLLRALVEFPFRARNPQVLADIARRVLGEPANEGAPDVAAALAVLGYQMLERQELAAAEVNALIRRMVEHLDRAIPSPHAVRWSISLRYLCASLLRRIGDLDGALEALDAVVAVDWRSFSPTIGTKIVDAAYEAGQLLAAAGRLEQARARWRMASEVAFEMLACGHEAYLGDSQQPQQFASIVGVELLDSATRSIKALRWSSPARQLPQERLLEQSRQCWKWMIRERTDSIASQARLLDQRWQILQSLDQMVSERDVAIRALEQMVSERDEVIQSQGHLIDARDESIRSMTALIDARDEALQGQADLLEARWKVMTHMDTEIAARDQIIASLNQKLGN